MWKLKNIFFTNWDLIIIWILVFLSLFPFVIQNGYFLWIDFIFWPEISLIDGQYYPNYILWINIQKLLSYIIPSIIIQKIIFISFFIVWIYSIRKFLSIFNQNKWIIFVLSILFIINPFIYPRLMQWQVYILFASALLPLVYYFLYHNKLLKLSIIIGIILSFSPHFIFIILPIVLLFYLTHSFNIKYKSHIIYAIIIILLINMYWIWNIFDKTNILNFNINDIQSFQSHTIYFKNIYLEILSLNWFWWDVEKRYLIEINNFKYFYIIFLVWWTIWWMIISCKKDKKNFSFFSILIIIWFILSLWISQNNIFSSINYFLYEYVPLYIWMRESNKFLILLLISYIYFISIFLTLLINKTKNNIIIIITFIIIIMQWSSITQIFWWQIKWYQYPNSWYEIKKYIKENSQINLETCKFKSENISKSCYWVIVFPRHQSIWLSFVKKITINPVWVFFWKEVLLWDNIEIRNIYSQSIRPESKIIEKYVSPKWKLRKNNFEKKELENFINDLKWLGIENIILLKEADYIWYKSFLDKLERYYMVSIEKEEDIIILYKIK